MFALNYWSATETQTLSGPSIWKVINHCFPNKEPPLTTVEDPVVQANSFNDFYVSVGEAAAVKAKALCDQFGFSDESVEQVEPTTDDLQNVNKFEFHAVTERDIEKIVKHIPSNKAPGQDKVSARVLKDSLPATRAVITNVIYSSFASNCFAQAWKSAVVIPKPQVRRSWWARKHLPYIHSTYNVKSMREGCSHPVYGLFG